MIKKFCFILAFISLLMLVPPLIQAQSKSLYIPAYAFMSREDDPDWVFKSGYIYPKDTGGGVVVVVAPVYLPDGANITKVIMRYWFIEPQEGEEARGIEGTMNRRNMYTDKEEYMVILYATSGGASWQTIEDTRIHRPIINNSGYSYYLHISISGQGDVIRLAGVKILYIEK